MNTKEILEEQIQYLADSTKQEINPAAVAQLTYAMAALVDSLCKLTELEEKKEAPQTAAQKNNNEVSADNSITSLTNVIKLASANSESQSTGKLKQIEEIIKEGFSDIYKEIDCLEKEKPTFDFVGKNDFDIHAQLISSELLKRTFDSMFSKLWKL